MVATMMMMMIGGADADDDDSAADDADDNSTMIHRLRKHSKIISKAVISNKKRKNATSQKLQTAHTALDSVSPITTAKQTHNPSLVVTDQHS